MPLDKFKKGDKLFIVDLTSVSFFDENALNHIAHDDELYEKTPFLYLISSYMKNASLSWADKNLKFTGKMKTGAWEVYRYEVY